MKVTFYLPAHPSYFDNEYTRQEIDEALALYDHQTGGLISKGIAQGNVRREVVQLREPGKEVTFAFDSAGYGDGVTVLPGAKDLAVAQVRFVERYNLKAHVEGITVALKFNRRQRGR